MSVFKNAVYRDNAFQWLARSQKVSAFNNQYSLSLLNFDVEDFGNFPVPQGLVAGNLEKQVIKQTVRLADLINKKRVKHDNNLSNLVKQLPRSKIGLHSVYHFIAKNWHEIFEHDRINHLRHENDGELHKGIFTLGLLASHHTPIDINNRSKTLIQQYREYYEPGVFFLRELWAIKSGSHSRRYRKACKDALLDKQSIPPLDPKDRRILKKYDIWVHKGTIIARPNHGLYCYTITPADLERIERVIKGFSNARIYPHQAFNYAKEEVNEIYNAILKYQELCRVAFLRLNNTTAQSMCRALDVVFHIEFAEISSDINKLAYHLQLEKFKTEKLDEIIDQNEFRNAVSRLPMNPRLEVLTQYKAMPQPDFDYFGAMERQRALYHKTQERNRRLYDRTIMRDVMRYHKWLMIITFHKLHHKCPGFILPTADFKPWHAMYDSKGPDNVPFREVDDIDFNGEFSWVNRTVDVVDLIKDKAICPVDVDKLESGFDTQDLPIEARNQLMDWVTRGDMPNIEDLAATMISDRYDVRAEDKPEAKKPNGRWFFEAGTDSRLIQSNYEESVAFYAKHFPGSCNGLSVAAKIEKMGKLSAERFDSKTQRQLFISFDIDKFSPALQLEIHQMLDRQWSNAFGQPHLVEAHRTFLDGNIHYLKGPIHHIMGKVGADFEGFSGRKLTCYHCALMGYVVRRMKERGWITGQSGFACLIDDGLLRVTVAANNYEMICNNIILFIDDIYKRCSMVISWDKTYVSEHTSIFLNDIRHRGRTIPLGLKACLKITSKSEAIIPSLLDELQMVESTCRGAIVSGAPMVLVYTMYSWHVTDLIRKWGRQDYQKALTLKAPIAAFVPVSFGGLGCVTGLHLEGSISAGGIEDNISALYIMGTILPALRPAINEFIGRDVTTKSVSQIAADPNRIQTNRRSLRSTRVLRVIERNLLNVVKSPLLSSMLSFVRGYSTTFAEQALMAGYNLPAELLDSLYRMEPKYAIEQFVLKFTKSTTASKVCPRHSLRNCAMANVSEAALVVKQFYVAY